MDARLLREYAGYLIRGGAPDDKALFTLEHLNGEIPTEELCTILASVKAKYGRNVSKAVDIYVGMTNQWFSTSDVYRDCQITPEERHAVLIQLGKLVADETLEKDKGKNGIYRLKNHSLNIIDWKTADVGNTWDIKLPFRIHELLNLYPRNVIMVGGEKNTGKTAWGNAIVKHNMKKFKIRTLVSEAEEEIKVRRSFHDDLKIDDWCDEMVSCSSHYADKVLKDGITVIDYLEVDAERPFIIANEVKDIYDAAGRGLVVIMIQKDPRKDFATGGKGGEEKARLVIQLMSQGYGKPNTCFLKMVKNYTTERSPSGTKIYYKVVRKGAGLMEVSRESPYVDDVMSPDQVKAHNAAMKEVSNGQSSGGVGQLPALPKDL